MSISLQKGQRLDLTKTNPGLKNVLIGLGWDVNKYEGISAFDLDAVAFLVTENNKVINEQDFIFYNNLKSADGSVQHLGDNLTGIGEGDDEQIKINLSKIPPHIHKIEFAVTIHESDIRKQNFGQVSNAFLRIVNEETDQEIARYDLSEDYSIETGVLIGEIYRHSNQWKFNAIGNGFSGGLATICKNFGLQVD